MSFSEMIPLQGSLQSRVTTIFSFREIRAAMITFQQYAEGLVQH
jgi:hypothetical protein